MSLRHDQRGSVTAEFAIVVPAVVLVVVLTAGLLMSSARQVRLEQAAAQGARLAARGEDAVRVRAAVSALVDGVGFSIRDEGDLVCVDVSAAGMVPVAQPTLRASACSLSGGR